MKVVLSILFINLIFVFCMSDAETDIDIINEVLLNEKDMQKFEKSFKKLKRFFRNLNLEDTTEPHSEDETQTESSYEESIGVESSEIESSNAETTETSGSESSGVESSSFESSSGEISGQDTSGQETSSGQESTVEESSGEESSGQDTTGQDTTGQETSGQDTSGQETSSGQESSVEESSGEESSGQETSGQDTTEQDTTGQETSGQDTSGQDTTGQETSGQETSGQETSGQETSGQETSGQETSGQETSGQETTAQETSGQETSGQETTAQETSGQETSGQDTSRPGTNGVESSLVEPSGNQTESHPPTYKPASGSHYSLIYILRFAYFRYTLTARRPIILQFVLFVYYRSISPFYRITFTLRITITIVIFRGLEEKEQNTTAECTIRPDSFDSETGIALYDCEASADEEPSRVESFNDYKFYNENGDLQTFNINETGINFSPDSKLASYNLLYQRENIQSLVSLDGIVTNNDTGSFYITGRLTGKDAEKIAEQNQITFTFFDIRNDNKTPVNETCNVVNHTIDNFQVKCDPVHNMTEYYIYQSNGTVDDIGITLNLTEYQDYVNVTRYSSVGYNKWRKNSSGLSGGAIAGIVIACAVVLILISILAMCFRKRKLLEPNNSTIVGLRTIDNENYNQ